MLFSLKIIVLITVIYPALSFSSLASCPSLQRTFNIVVIAKSICSICYTIFGLIKNSNIIDTIER